MTGQTFLDSLAGLLIALAAFDSVSFAPTSVICDLICNAASDKASMTITLAAAMNCVNAAASRRFHTQQLLRRLVVRAAFSPACACRHFAVSAAVSAKGTRSKSRLRTTNHAALHEDAEEEKQQATPTVSIHNDKTHTHSQLLSPQLSAVHGAASKSSTPAMRQWQQLKRANPKHLLLFRLGDFYELFDDDAIQAAQTLQLTLTKRNKHLMAGQSHASVFVIRTRVIPKFACNDVNETLTCVI